MQHYCLPTSRFLPSRRGLIHRPRRSTHVACMRSAASRSDPSEEAAARNSWPKRILICGGGVIGACTAYYLAERGAAERVTVVEREEVACAASGKAGGFLALDWNDGSPTEDLSRLSYKLHAELAQKFGADSIGYRTVHAVQIAAKQEAQPMLPGKGKTAVPAWVDGNVVSSQTLGTPSSTSQVHPRLLTHALMDSATARGARLVKGTAHGIARDDGGSLQGLLVDGVLLESDAVVLAMGPWTSSASHWLPPDIQLDIAGLKYHSCVVRPEQGVSNHCLEARVMSAAGRQLEVEVYPRPDGSVYMCGQPQQVAVPLSAAQISVDPALVQQVWGAAASLASRLGQGKAVLEAQQSCFLPISSDGQPLIGQVPAMPGVYVAAGHSCWGILNGPATGKAMAELILDGTVSCLPGGLGAALGLERLRGA